MSNPSYGITVLPGVREGISASILGGFNLSISKYISKEKEKASIDAIKYITSFEVQKKFAKMGYIISAISDIYIDKEVCAFIDCSLYRNSHFIGRPMNKADNYEEYSEMYRNYFYEFLYKDKEASEVLKKIDDITKIYYISVSGENYGFGLILIILTSIINAIILLSLLFLFNENYNCYFEFLSTDLWIMSNFGLITFLSSSFTMLGKITILKCYLKIMLISIGYTLNLTPILYKLIICFPENNKFSEYVNKHKFIFFFTFIFIDLISFGIYSIDGFNVNDIYNIDNYNFQKCELSTHTSYIFITMNVLKFLLLMMILLLIFIEWNIDIIHNDLKFLVFSFYFITITVIFSIILKRINLNNFILYYILWESLIIVTSLLTYTFEYGYKIILGLLNRPNIKLKFIVNINQKFISNEKSTYNNETKIYKTTVYTDDNNTIMKDENNNENDQKTKSINSNRHSYKSGLMSKIVEYHYNRYSYDGRDIKSDTCASDHF